MQKKIKKKIILAPDYKKEIAQRLDWSVYSVGEALRYQSDSVKAHRARLMAIEEYKGKVVSILQP